MKESVNVAEVFPGWTCTVDETDATEGLLLRRATTTAPLAGVAPFRVTVPVADAPPGTEVGLSVRPARTGGLTRKVAVLDTVPSEAVMTASTAVATGDVLSVKLAEVA